MPTWTLGASEFANRDSRRLKNMKLMNQRSITGTAAFHSKSCSAAAPELGSLGGSDSQEPFRLSRWRADNQNNKQRKKQSNEHLETIVRRPLKVGSTKN